MRTLYDRTPPHEHRVVLTPDRLTAGAVIDEPVLVDNGVVQVSVSVDVRAGEGGATLVVEVALQNRRITDGTLPPRLWLFQAELEALAEDGSAVFLPIHDPLDALAPGSTARSSASSCSTVTDSSSRWAARARPRGRAQTPPTRRAASGP